MNRPYIGVTGFTTSEEVAAVREVYPDDNPRLLMVGVLATWKSLRNIPVKPKWKRQIAKLAFLN